MAIIVNGTPKRLGLALSGGGFRAAAFHLGVMRRLKHLGLLDKIDVFSCVSGGSIAGGFVALNWTVPDVLDQLETYLRSNSIAVSSVLEGMFSPFHTRLDRLADEYDDELFKKKSLSALRLAPRIYFGTTNLATGNYFAFVAGGQGQAEMGEHEFGYSPAENFPISAAVAASSAFPPVFPPCRLDRSKYPKIPKAVGSYTTLTDGGVYDNMGINPLVSNYNKVDYAIVSDGGAPFRTNSNPTEAGSVVLKHALDIMMEQIRGLQFQRLKLAHKSGTGPKPLWFSIDSSIGSTAEDATLASAISTDLRALSLGELAVLTRHGSALVEARLRTYAHELVGVGP